MNKSILYIFLLSSLLLFYSGCKQEDEAMIEITEEQSEVLYGSTSDYLYEHKVEEDITIGNYFEYIDQLVAHYDSITPYLLTEHLLVRANPWLIDSLAETDYYRMMEKGQFVYDQKSIVVLHKADQLMIPGMTKASKLMWQMTRTELDINIPEFKLRIKEGDRLLFTFPVRVGQNRERYLETAGRMEDLRTRTGCGQVVEVKRDPTFINPVDGKRFEQTRRDDNKVTLMPLIPWIDLEIDGHRYGQMLHPTTNPKSLGKAYSNGCIGTKEADAWYIYYYAPIGTNVEIRYDLEVVNSEGDTLVLKDIYSK